MGKLKEKDIQYIYDAISESEMIQNLIRTIADSSGNKNTGNAESERLQSQISSLQSQLQQANKSLEQYKNFYIHAKSELEKNEKMQKEIENLKSEISDYEADMHEKSTEIKKLRTALDKANNKSNELLSKLKIAEKNADRLKKQFDTPINFLDMYRELSNSTRSGLKNVISDKNEITFIASCSNENNLSSIWEYTKDISGDSAYADDFKTLCRIFDYFFDVFNDSLPDAKYIRDNVEPGDYLDDDYHDRCAGSATSGEITEIILRGYKSKNTGRIIHKSLVKAQ